MLLNYPNFIQIEFNQNYRTYSTYLNRIQQSYSNRMKQIKE